MTDFENRVVIVTGAAGVLGKAVAAELSGRGARIVPIDIVPMQGPAPGHLCDLNDASACAATAATIHRESGRIDALVNVAGGFTMGERVHETTDATWNFMLELNARTVLNMARAVVPYMLEVKRGRIVNVAARAGLRGNARMAAYAASKSVVIRLTEALDEELKEHGINANCVLPSIIDTPRNRADMPEADYSRWVAPTDLAKVIAFLASDDAHAIHGAAIPVDGLA